MSEGLDRRPRQACCIPGAGEALARACLAATAGVRAGRENQLPGLNLDLCGGGRGGRFRPIKSTSKRGGEKITPQRPLFVAAHYTALRSILLSVRADDFIHAILNSTAVGVLQSLFCNGM